jgi:cyclophilin family peptidyl-prolyl cis-trans isomerase/outer membrane protein assembly factor BamD (BamD/ComL family)
MAQHKAPTAVTIASTDSESEFRNWIAKYWVYGALLAAGVLVWAIYTQQSKTNTETKRRDSWSKLLAVATQDPRTGMLAGPPDDLRRVGGELKGTDAGPWALYLAASSAAASRDFERARSCLTELEQTYPQHPIVAQAFVEGAPALSPAKLLEKRIDDELAFVREHPTLFSNPELPADAPRVRLTTDKGAIVIGLYKDAAPKLTENFLKLVKEGAYVGTKFHAVVKSQYIRGGDPNSAKGEATTWGKGGPGYTLEKEATGLKNFAGAISATPDAEDPTKLSGSQFLISSTDVHSLDEMYIPFGKVLEGMDVITSIESLPLVEKSFTQPKEPATIVSAEVL